jgi:ABC-type antimicrobial peptide transport system permease subunit
MLKHYLTVAFRNLRKYKSQSVISIIGLAVGFTCFALASLWIRYEMTYDHFHKKADRIYTVSTPDSFNPHGFDRTNPYPLAAYLKETFPEVSNACNIDVRETKIRIDSIWYPVWETLIDSSFLTMFDIQILEGNSDFTIEGSNKIAITAEKAKAFFPNESALGKTAWGGTIGAVVSGWSKHSNYPFDILSPKRTFLNWNGERTETLIELAQGVNVVAFKEKLYEHVIEQETSATSSFTLSQIQITPLTTMRYEDPNINREVKFEHIILFAIAGTLVILCSLFNYLTLFVCRFKMREKEFALRVVAGASGRSLFSLWSVEFLMSLIPAFLLSLILIHITFSPFLKLSGIRMDLSSIYFESAIYIAFVIAVSLLVFMLILSLFRRKSLHASIRKNNKNRFRETSIVFQLIISIGFIFCTLVMIKQLYFLHHTDLGFTYKNTASVSLDKESHSEVLNNQLKQIPEITETLAGYFSLLHPSTKMSLSTNIWEDKSSDMENVKYEIVNISKQYAEFYDFQLIEGELLNEGDLFSNENPLKNVLINESAAKAFGWKHSVGKTFNDGFYTVKGVVRNVCSSLPVPIKPVLYLFLTETSFRSSVLFKYQEGKWETCKSKIKELMEKEHPHYSFEIYNMEEDYNQYFVSENALLKLLSLLSSVCVIISIFGVFSLISLSCEEKRKEIAIRKINGATMLDILSMYFKTYFSLLIIGSVIAFPIGYYIMKQWIEKYIKQTDISSWIYLSIIFAMAAVIILCVGWRVYRASVENPAEVLKTE